MVKLKGVKCNCYIDPYLNKCLAATGTCPCKKCHIPAQITGNEECVWCGKTYEEHESVRDKNSPFPRTPCLSMKGGFVPRSKFVVTSTKEEEWKKELREKIKYWDKHVQQVYIAPVTEELLAFIEEKIKDAYGKGFADGYEDHRNRSQFSN